MRGTGYNTNLTRPIGLVGETGGLYSPKTLAGTGGRQGGGGLVGSPIGTTPMKPPTDHLCCHCSLIPSSLFKTVFQILDCCVPTLASPIGMFISSAVGGDTTPLAGALWV